VKALALAVLAAVLVHFVIRKPLPLVEGDNWFAHHLNGGGV
jgi:hypothetical protein